MSKQQDAKALQGYVPKAEPQTCGNCVQFRSELGPPEKYGYQKEMNIHCGLEVCNFSAILLIRVCSHSVARVLQSSIKIFDLWCGELFIKLYF